MLVRGLVVAILTTYSHQDAQWYGDLQLNLKVTEDAKLLVPDIIAKYGYPCEIHTVVSQDGYILEMHRIPFGKDGPSENRSAVYVQHGLLSSSADWILKGKTRYALADAGYDVWLANVRGTRYSRRHMFLNPDKNASSFWDFSWHNIGVDDVPTMIDYILITVKQRNIFYIGHSQGTTVFFVMCSERPQYNEKIRAMFSFAPVAWLKYMTSPLLRVISMADSAVGSLFQAIGMYEFLPQRSFLADIGGVLCGDDSLLQPLCANALFAICGFNQKQMNASLIPIIMGHTPAGAATKQFLHYTQQVNSGHFRQYDYGLFANIGKYGSAYPPDYQMKKVVAPVYLYYSRNDWLSHEIDVIRLSEELGNLKDKFIIIDDKFNHLDYLYGIDVYELLYKRVIALMKQH
ncbi:lipase 3-like isoform X2 [Photinus pyralis]|uniref:lipase 3-like isoform X2 n=1 Tax=Photinus pyralis TaxID=7054 RepID=UPI00126767D9|nr:lipase 3-like isoform X2 [Photinus pyralis]